MTWFPALIRRLLPRWRLAAALTALVTLAACSVPASPSETVDVNGDFQVTEIDTPAGPAVCVTWNYGKAGGLSCRWSDVP